MFLLGIDIGGTKCAVVLGKPRNEIDPTKDEIDIIDKIKFPTIKGVDIVISKLFEAVKNMLNKHQLETSQIAMMGINCGGPLNSRDGIILSPPNLIGWINIPIVKIFFDKFGIPCKLQNDAKAGALAEWLYGAGKGYSNVMFITFGTGFGSGLILDNKLYLGTNDMAGEVGHLRMEPYGPVGFGKAGSLEGFCSGGGIAQLAKAKVLEKLQLGESVSFCKNMEELETLNAKIVGDAAEAGDALALEIYEISGTYLGKGLSLFIDILNPQVIIIGSIFARSRDILWPHAKKVIEKETISHARAVCKVVPAGLGERIGDLEALSIAAYELMEGK
ncbi:MAG: ROK family protein [Clostridiales bacterium]|nr:ROK family protein [Clostridiales bacterium]